MIGFFTFHPFLFFFVSNFNSNKNNNNDFTTPFNNLFSRFFFSDFEIIILADTPLPGMHRPKKLAEESQSTLHERNVVNERKHIWPSVTLKWGGGYPSQDLSYPRPVICCWSFTNTHNPAASATTVRPDLWLKTLLQNRRG